VTLSAAIFVCKLAFHGTVDNDAMMHSRQIFDDQLYAHFVTFSCDRRRRLLCLEQPKRIVLGVLSQEIRRQSAKCVGFVIMPDHVHAIVWFPAPGRLSVFMHEWKRFSSRLIREWYEAQKMNYFEVAPVCNRFWMPKYHSFEIYGRPKLEEKLDYMHLNPVRAGLVAHACGWAWSSARWYLEGKNVGVALSWVE
jgi:REP-associated tyrosine transposase